MYTSSASYSWMVIDSTLAVGWTVGSSSEGCPGLLTRITFVFPSRATCTLRGRRRLSALPLRAAQEKGAHRMKAMVRNMMDWEQA